MMMMLEAKEEDGDEMRAAASGGKNLISSEMTLDERNRKSAPEHHNDDDDDDDDQEEEKDCLEQLSSSGYSSSSAEGSCIREEKILSGNKVPSSPIAVGDCRRKNCQVLMSRTDSSCFSFQVSYLGKIVLDKEAHFSLLGSTNKKSSLAKTVLDKMERSNEDEDGDAEAILDVRSEGVSVHCKDKILVSHGLRSLRMWSPIESKRALFAFVAQDCCHVIACGGKSDAAEVSKRLREMVWVARKADSDRKKKNRDSHIMTDCTGKGPLNVMSRSLPSKEYFESGPLPKKVFKRLKFLGAVVVNRCVGIDLIHGAIDVASGNNNEVVTVDMSVSTASLSIEEHRGHSHNQQSNSETEIRLSKVTFMGISESCPSKFAFIAEEGGSFSAHVFECGTVDVAGSLSRSVREACEDRYRRKCEVERGKEEISRRRASLVGRALLKWRERIIKRKGRQK